ncbi:MAG: radical SAM protein [Treponema sp.]|jgi:MoaA/NifB/PqqE/SkfB family radical SAM enzyme|nr:radical SAM protein [Treponema sp.]
MGSKRSESSFYQSSGEKKLDSVFLFATGKCNARCAHCFYAVDMDKLRPDLDTEDWKKIARTSKTVQKLWISGGEPTLREDLPEIIEEFYNNNPLKDINLPSNGILGDRIIEWFSRLRTSCPKLNITFGLSLDGFAISHDRQRGVPIFYKAVETLKRVEDTFKDDAHIQTNLATCVTKINLDEIPDFYQWAWGRLGVTSHVCDGARGETREGGIKCVTEEIAQELQDRFAPYYIGYGRRMAARMGGGFVKRYIQKTAYIGLIRSLFAISRSNMTRPTPWGMNCPAGETTLVIDYDGRFRVCEIRDPIGSVKDYGCDTQEIMRSDVMKKEIEMIGHGYTANCWCQHGCWITSALLSNPKMMFRKIQSGYREVKRLAKGMDLKKCADREVLEAIEKKYNLDSAKLKAIGVIT